MKTMIYGIGINDVEGASKTSAYKAWNSMLRRCYSSSFQDKFPTYKGCTVCDEWRYFSNFKTWYDLHYKHGFQLDKDLLVAGNKEYSPNTCRFVPHRINSLLIDCGASRGKFPIGVTKHGKRFQVTCTIDKRKKCFGTFDNTFDALRRYSKVKLSNVKRVCREELQSGSIGNDLHDAIISQCRDSLVCHLRCIRPDYVQPNRVH